MINFRVRIDLNVMPRGPVEKIIHFDCLLRTFRVGGGKLAMQDETPVSILAHIAFQPLEQRGRVHAAESVKYSVLIFPNPVASPKSICWRITAPGISILISTSFIAIRMIDSPLRMDAIQGKRPSTTASVE